LKYSLAKSFAKHIHVSTKIAEDEWQEKRVDLLLFDEEDARPWETMVVSCRQMYDVFCSMVPDDPPTTPATTTAPSAETTRDKSFDGKVIFGQSSKTNEESILIGCAELGYFLLSGEPDNDDW
jgi:hypothetical protein